MSTFSIVGYFSPLVSTDIPRILTAAVKVDDRVLRVDSEEDLKPEVRDEVSISVSDFSSLADRGDATYTEGYPWVNGLVPFLPEVSTKVEMLPLAEVEGKLRAFVDHCRGVGEEALKCQSDFDAILWFDRARRVSNEPDDYVRLYMLESFKRRDPWLDWLKHYYPDLDVAGRAEALGILPSTPIFRSVKVA